MNWDFILNTQWQYFAYVVPLVVFNVILLWRNRKFIREGIVIVVKWMRPSMESGGTASPEKLTAFAVLNFVYIPGRLRFVWTIDDPWHQLLAFCLDVVFILILFRIISPREVIELKTGLRYKEDHKEEQKSETP